MTTDQPTAHVPSGPLAGTRVLELGGIGPGPYAAMMLSGLGAEVLRIEAPSSAPPTASAFLHRGRSCVGLDLTKPGTIDLLLGLVSEADVLMEGHRPGVAERLGFGPDVCLDRNPRLVYARMTGYGQHGPLAGRAGHDINYIALAGAMGALGRPDEPPPPPLNLVGDFGGGGLLMVTGILAALLERGKSGRGQVVDAAMVDGVASFMAMFLDWHHYGDWLSRGTNLLDGGAPFYDTYRTADDKYVAVGALEPKFYAQLLELLDLADVEDPRNQTKRSEWPRLKEVFATVFATRTRDEWEKAAEDYDACLTPVLEFDELADHPHLRERETYTRRADGTVEVASAPRFSRTPGSRPTTTTPTDRVDLLRSWGIDASKIADAVHTGAIFTAPDMP